jgi:hypothetical protein
MCLLSAARAAVIYHNGSGAAGNGLLAELTGPTVTREAADDFSLLPGQNTIREVHWWGAYGTSPAVTDNFTIKVYANLGTPPNNSPANSVVATINILQLERTATPLSVVLFGAERPIFEYHAAISPLTLAANTTYWLGFSNNTGLRWAQSAVQGDLSRNAFVRFGGSGEFNFAGIIFQEIGYSTSFYLTDVPEPSSAILLVLGGTLAWGIHRRRARH